MIVTILFVALMAFALGVGFGALLMYTDPPKVRRLSDPELDRILEERFG